MTAAFRRDYARLSAAEQNLVKSAIRELNEAYAKHMAAGKTGVPTWPKRLRGKAMQAADKILELTWNFSGPDGRATFEYVQVHGELGIRWRRIGSHVIFTDP